MTARVVVRGGQPAGGVERIVAHHGDVVRIAVSSPDAKGEVHLHGYDLEREVGPGEPATLRFTANLEGIFTLEDHETDAELAKVEVRP